MGKRVLLTGAGGFIGAHCVEYFLEKTDWEILALDSFRHKGTYRRIDEIENFNPERVKVFRHDLSVPIDHQLENLLLDRTLDGEKSIDIIINMASESAVERSTIDPGACVRNNVELAINMLEFARVCQPKLFLQVSTDEVYGEATSLAGHKEWSTILPSNPYAASKAAQEALAIAYWRTYDLPIVISNCMNIIGEKQDPEKFLPKLIQFIATGQEMPIYADSEDSIGSRVYLHARNKADALIFIAGLPVARYSQKAERLDRYNICGQDELDNLQMGKLMAKIMGKELKYKLIPSESARPGYDRRYALDGAKLTELGWNPPMKLEESLKRIAKWTMDNPHWLL